MAKKHSLSNNLVIGLIGFAVIAFGLVGLVLAYGENIVNNFYGDTQVNQASEAPPLSGDILGSTGLTTTGTPSLYSGFTSINLTEELRFGDDTDFMTEGISIWTRVVDFTDATISPVVIQNKYGETVYITELGLQILGKATSTVSTIIATSTTGVIIQDGTTEHGDGEAATLFSDKLLNAFGAEGGSYATGTLLWLKHYPGTAGIVNLPLEWKPDIYLVVSATSSDIDGSWSIIGSDNTFDGELYLELKRID